MTAEVKKKPRMSEVAKAEERTALMLLIPSFVIIIVIAIYPLFTVFRDGFTNRIFASGQPSVFIGLDNYRRLLGITIKELPPIIDEETGVQAVDPETGEKLYERPVRVLPRMGLTEREAVQEETITNYELSVSDGQQVEDGQELGTRGTQTLTATEAGTVRIEGDTLKIEAQKTARYRELSQFSLFGKRYVIGATEPDFIQAIKDTLIFTVITVFMELVLGLGIALVVNSGFKGRGLMRATMLVPWAIPTVVSAKIWEWMFKPTRVGLFNVVLNAVGVGDGQFAFLREASLQLPALIAVDVWKTTPFMALLLLAGLQTIPGDLYEAADVDGAGRVRQFLSITLPMLRPALVVALIFRTLDALRVFDIFSVLLARTRYSMASYTQDQLIQYQASGISSASSVVIFLMIFVFAMLYIRALGVESR
jgi:trehalose/maltose transport system permease protein